MLGPSSCWSKVKCSLESVHLDNAPSYEALSYCWGDVSNKCNIAISRKAIAVTRNLYAVLSELRLRHESMLLWIDALCTNQQDLTEQSYQVKLIGEIYTTAKRVIVWLGKAGNDSLIAMRVISELPEDLSADTALKISQDQSIVRPIMSLLQRSWWSRTWIIQEVALAKRVVVLCGSAFFFTGIDSHI